MYARQASFDDELAKAYGITWGEDLFAPADEDSRYTTDVEAFIGAQNEWMTNHLPKRGTVIEVNEWGQPKLPAKAERVWGKPGKSDCTGWYLDRDGQIQSVAYRMLQVKKAKGKDGEAEEAAADDIETTAKPRPDVTRKGMEMIGDLRTDALHEALARAPIEDDTLLALLVLAFAGQNVSIASGNADGYARIGRHAARLIGEDGKLGLDRDTLQQVARATLIDVLSCRENRSDSGVAARMAGDAIGADTCLPNMATEDFLSCLSRTAIEAACKDTSVLPRQRVKDTRAALVQHYAENRFVHPAALFAPAPEKVAAWTDKHGRAEDDEESGADALNESDEAEDVQPADGYAEAAE